MEVSLTTVNNEYINKHKEKIVHKMNHLSIVLYEGNANIKNIAIVEIYLNGNQEFIFFKRVATPHPLLCQQIISIIFGKLNFNIIPELPI